MGKHGGIAVMFAAAVAAWFGASALASGSDRPAREAPRVARALVKATRTLDVEIDRWRLGGDPASGGPPRAVELAALRQQRVFLRLSSDERLAEAVVPRLRGRHRRHAEATLAARRALIRLGTTRRPLSSFRTRRPLPPRLLLRYYRQAERRFGVGWPVLAAVNFIETAFGRMRGPSSAGALGPMQFMPLTWRAYGLGGNVHRPRDAIMGAANYLRATGAPRDYRTALYAYNHSWHYVDAVLHYARRMRHDIRAYYAYYSWQVYVLTPDGPKRLTGPGLRR